MSIPIALKAGRCALARMYIDLSLAFHASTFKPGNEPDEIDGNLTLVAVAVMLGHAEGHAMNASELSVCLTMPRTSVLRRLDILIERGLIERIDDQYYLHKNRAGSVPHLDAFELILSKAFTALTPLLSKSDR